jgi:hypothetical protein
LFGLGQWEDVVVSVSLVFFFEEEEEGWSGKGDKRQTRRRRGWMGTRGLTRPQTLYSCPRTRRNIEIKEIKMKKQKK